jgi:NADH-quinone oxidoreductase subunit A
LEILALLGRPIQVLGQALASPPANPGYAAIGVLILMAIGTAAAMLIVAHVFGPKRHGPVKDSPYESGVPPIVDTHRRFNIRFYIVAMLFMLFDVEVIFMWPWALAFYESATKGATVALDDGTMVGKGFLLTGMAIFFVLLVFGLVYEWKKGAFEWD